MTKTGRFAAIIGRAAPRWPACRAAAAGSIDKVPAKELFGRIRTPAPLAARSIGFYAKGCLAGAAALPVDGPAWQAMRLSRNRMWGHPALIALIERLAERGQGRRRLAGPAGRGLVAAARRADADRPCQPPGRPRCRHLADAHAGPHPLPQGARETERHQRHHGLQDHRSQGVDRSACQADQARGLLSARSRASSSIRRSRRRCAAGPTGNRSGSPRSAPITATPITSISA